MVQHGGKRDAFWTGMLACGCQHSCPVCAQRRAAERAAELDCMFRADDGARWQMVTLTLRHSSLIPLVVLLVKLFAAWRKVRSTRVVREIMTRRVRASARSLEVKFSWKNGWHPHFHILWHTSEWTAHERRLLLREWARAVGERKTVRFLIRWSTPIREWSRERARYLSKLGAEVAGIGKDDAGEHLSPFHLAAAMLDGDENAAERWSEYQRAMKGRRILELDERAKALACAGFEAHEPDQTWTITFYGEEIRALASVERHNPTILWDILNAGINSTGPPAAIDAFLRVHLDNLNRRPSTLAA